MSKLSPNLKKSLSVFILAALFGGWVGYHIFGFFVLREKRPVKMERNLMGTRWSIEVAPERAMDRGFVFASIDAAFEEVARVESVMSEWLPNSPLSAVNAAAGERTVPVPAELRAIIERAIRISERTDGAFDITWKGLGGLWNFKAQDFKPPSEKAISEKLPLLDYRKIIIAEDGIGLPEKGMAIGLGGIAKGYGVDRAAAVLETAGIHDFYIDGGGDIRVSGRKFGKPWRVGIRHPRKGRESLLGLIEATSGAVVSSGDYERFKMVDGVRYHHIIDPRTGRPARRSQAVTVVAPTAERADALATALFVLGPEKGLEVARQEPRTEALMVDENGQIRLTEGLKRRFIPVK